MAPGARARLGSASDAEMRRRACGLAAAILFATSASATLPISIRNEADVAVENGRRHLEAAQREDGFWTMDDRATVLPAFAFLGAGGDEPPAPLAAAARAALARLAEAMRQPPPSVRGDAADATSHTPPSVRGDAPEGQGGVFLAEDALILAATLSLHGPDALGAGPSPQGLLAAARTRLLRLDPATQPPASAWLARCALDLIPGRPEQPADWAPLFSSKRGARPPAAPPACAAAPFRGCAIAGYARIRHGVGADTPAAILAHLRWLRAHAGDLLGDETPPAPSGHPPQGGGQRKEEAPPSVRGDAADAPSHTPPSVRGEAAERQGGVSPEDLYFAAVFLDAAPPALVATAGIPSSWRSRIAQRLVATARSDGRSGSVWTDSGAAPSLRQTLYAVATLAALGE